MLAADASWVADAAPLWYVPDEWRHRGGLATDVIEHAGHDSFIKRRVKRAVARRATGIAQFERQP